MSQQSIIWRLPTYGPRWHLEWFCRRRRCSVGIKQKSVRMNSPNEGQVSDRDEGRLYILKSSYPNFQGQKKAKIAQS